MESTAWRELVKRINDIDVFIRSISEEKTDLDEMYVDGEAVCKYLRISTRTLQRMRSKRLISYTMIGNKSYYTIGEIKRGMQSKMIRSSEAYLQDLIRHYTTEISDRKK